jgi:hypothetical protein
MTSLTIGSIGSPDMLSGDYARRHSLMDQIGESAIDHLFLADHVSFHNGLGMDGLINAATLAASNPRISIMIGVYLLADEIPLFGRIKAWIQHRFPKTAEYVHRKGEQMKAKLHRE